MEGLAVAEGLISVQKFHGSTNSRLKVASRWILLRCFKKKRLLWLSLSTHRALCVRCRLNHAS